MILNNNQIFRSVYFSFHWRQKTHMPLDPLPLPALHASHGGCWLRDGRGNTRGLGKGEAIMAAADTPLLMLNAPLVASHRGWRGAREGGAGRSWYSDRTKSEQLQRGECGGVDD